MIPKVGTEFSDGLELFPQRVPVPGFFEELFDSEIPEFRVRFASIQAEVLRSLREPRAVVGRDAIRFCNLVDLAARLGLVAEVARLKPTITLDSSVTYLAAQKLETYRDADRRADGRPVDLSSMQALAKNCTYDLVRGVIIARMFVVSARYDRSRRLDDLHAEALGIARAARPTVDLERIWLSMIFRALPMAQGTPPELAHEWMANSVALAEQIEAPLIRDELLFTTHLSVAKMHLSLRDPEKAERALEMVVALDPLDSSGHSELGLFHHRADRFAQALPHFETAFALGPPSYAMNAFFVADCLHRTGRVSEAKAYLHASAKADPFGLSPRLKLLEVLREERDGVGAKEIAREILGSADLREQLEPDELRLVQSV